jgi:Mg2+-importing ATPase
VDTDFTKKPKRWNLKLIGKFMLYFGFLSSTFDLALILPMVFWWNFPASIFRTAWFVESSLSEMIITFAIRTKLPFYKSAPGKFLLTSSIISALVVIVSPFLKIGKGLFEFANMPIYLWGWIAGVLMLYFLAAEIIKRIFFRKYEL